MTWISGEHFVFLSNINFRPVYWSTSILQINRSPPLHCPGKVKFSYLVHNFIVQRQRGVRVQTTDLPLTRSPCPDFLKQKVRIVTFIVLKRNKSEQWLLPDFMSASLHRKYYVSENSFYRSTLNTTVHHQSRKQNVFFLLRHVFSPTTKQTNRPCEPSNNSQPSIDAKWRLEDAAVGASRQQGLLRIS